MTKNIVRITSIAIILLAIVYNNSIAGFEFYGIVYCKTPTACVHEQGHALDTRLRNPSRSDNFRTAITNYTQTALLSNNRNVFVDAILVFPGVNQPRSNNGLASILQGGWGGYSELYATIYQLADGDIGSIPPELQLFYDGDE